MLLQSKETPATMELVDLAGLSKGAGKGAGLGNSFLSFAAESDALLHVVRVFKNADVPHPEESIDPLRDWKIVETELIYRDLGVIENRVSRLAAKKKITPEETSESEILKKMQDNLMEERPLREFPLSDAQKKALAGFAFLTLKPELIVLNMSETQKEDEPLIKPITEAAEKAGLSCARLFGSLEMDLAMLAQCDQEEFMKDLGIEELGRDRLIHEAYRLLGLISFFTSGKDEVRAWTLEQNSTAVDAAGAIHSDLARGFIRAQVVAYDDFVASGAAIAACRDKGLLRLEGKEYIVKDGDMIEIRFNV
ncbi:ribosome-binding ATPase YchF [Synergistales bacterium]|nr:ribosome-binding ATPase YchF [Synergistales bacterium]